MNNITQGKIALIGTGMVGMSFAYSCLNQGIGSEIVLIDIDKEKSQGEAMDLNHGLAFAPSPVKIYSGEYSDCSDAEIVVITAGAPQKTGESRLDLVTKNTKIIKEITKNIMKSGFNGIILVASNPVDIMSQVVLKTSKLPSNKVVGSGTTLDSARLRYELSRYFEISPKNIHAYIIGEHGDSEFPCFSSASVGVKSIEAIINTMPQYNMDDLHNIALAVKTSAYKIIEAKKSTYYGIGMSLAKIVSTILGDENAVLPLSCYLNGEYGHSEIYIGVPAIINRNGIKKIQQLPLNDEEQQAFDKSVTKLKEAWNSIDL